MAVKKQKYLENRELSWLKFNERVLEEAADSSVPLCERMSFLSIFQSNLDEFFMVRVGSLHDQMLVDKNARDNKTGMTSKEQLSAIFESARILSEQKDLVYRKYMELLKEKGVEFVSFANMLPEGLSRQAGLNRAAVALANAGDFEDAMALAKSIPDKAAAGACILDVAALRWNSDPKAAAGFMNQVDFTLLSSDSFADFCAKIGVQPSLKKGAAAYFENAISVLEKLQGFDPQLTRAWVEKLSEKLIENPESLGLESNVSRICLVMLNCSMESRKIQDFAYEAVLRANSSNMGRIFADLGAYAALKGKSEDAEGFFKKSAAICKSPKGQAGRMYLLWQMCASGFDRAKAVEIAGEFLPKISGR